MGVMAKMGVDYVTRAACLCNSTTFSFLRIQIGQFQLITYGAKEEV